MATFGILALELAMIRWTSGQIRIFAYFNNLVLIAAFLGMGLGLALGRRRPRLHHWTVPVLLLLSVPLAFSGPLGLMHIRFPDATVALWGGEISVVNPVVEAKYLLPFFGLVVGVIALFACAGSAVGALFAEAPPLRAYSADLLGSLAGVAAFTAATALDAGPPVWLLLGGLPFAWLSGRASSWIGLAAVVALGFHSVQGALFSPYNRIDLQRGAHGYTLEVNRDFHQFMHDLSDAMLTAPRIPPKERRTIAHFRLAYDVPFVVNSARDRALVVGAGTGNDVQAALRNGYRSVQSVDIDGRIIALGRELHPEQPYRDARVGAVVDDARSYFQRYRGPPFDVVCYGLLDSHAMFSALSTLRLDNYVYTEEGIRSAWRLVSDQGHLTISFAAYAGPWFVDRLYWTIARATGVRPVILNIGIHSGFTFLVARPPVVLDLVPVKSFPLVRPASDLASVRTTTDDWPFLYTAPGKFPVAYVVVLTGMLALAFVSARRVFGPRALGADFDPVLFLMGAGFLLVETRGVTTLSLLFGSTWMVNVAVFGGVLVMALLANVYVARLGSPPLDACFALLLWSVVLLAVMDNSFLTRLDLAGRGMLGGLINALPVGFAGIIVSTLLARSANPTAALGSNLLGSVLGGCLEYLSMLVGLRALAMLAFAIYLGALLLCHRRPAVGAVPALAETSA